MLKELTLLQFLVAVAVSAFVTFVGISLWALFF